MSAAISKVINRSEIKESVATHSPDQIKDTDTIDKVAKSQGMEKVGACKCKIQRGLPGGEEGACNKINKKVEELTDKSALEPTSEADKKSVDLVKRLLSRCPDKEKIELVELLNDPERKITNEELAFILLQIKEIRILALYKYLEDAAKLKHVKLDPNEPPPVSPELRKAVIELLEEEQILDKDQIKALESKVDSRKHKLEEFNESVKRNANVHLERLAANISISESRVNRSLSSALSTSRQVPGAVIFSTEQPRPRIILPSTSSVTSYSNPTTDIRDSSSFRFSDHTIEKGFKEFADAIVAETLHRKKEEKEDRQDPVIERKEEEEKLAFVANLNPELKKALAYVQLQFADLKRLSNGEILEMLERILHTYRAFSAIA